MDKEKLLKFIRFFREKTQTNKLIVFVGAGVSKNTEKPSFSAMNLTFRILKTQAVNSQSIRLRLMHIPTDLRLI